MGLFKKTEAKKKQEAEVLNPFDIMDENKLYEEVSNDLFVRPEITEKAETIKKSSKDVADNLKAEILNFMQNRIEQFYKISGEKRDRLLVRLEKDYFGYHVLDELMKDETISDIKVLAWDNVRVKRLGKRENTEVRFFSKKDFVTYIQRLAIRNEVGISGTNVVKVFTDKTSSEDFRFRYNITTGMINSTEAPYLHIRKIPKKKKDMNFLISEEMLDRETADYLIDRMANGYTVICGAGASGKTTLLNALIDELPHNKSALVVQESEELFTYKHPDIMFQHKVENGDGLFNIGLKELTINGLLVDLDYIIIGEIKGDEALYFLNAAYTGHLGIATVHGNDSQNALDKLADYAKYASDYSKDELMKMLACVKTVVFMKDYKVAEITEVEGWKEDELKMRVVFDNRRAKKWM